MSKFVFAVALVLHVLLSGCTTPETYTTVTIPAAEHRTISTAMFRRVASIDQDEPNVIASGKCDTSAPPNEPSPHKHYHPLGNHVGALDPDIGQQLYIGLAIGPADKFRVIIKTGNVNAITYLPSSPPRPWKTPIQGLVSAGQYPGPTFEVTLEQCYNNMWVSSASAPTSFRIENNAGYNSESVIFAFEKSAYESVLIVIAWAAPAVCNPLDPVDVSSNPDADGTISWDAPWRPYNGEPITLGARSAMRGQRRIVTMNGNSVLFSGKIEQSVMAVGTFMGPNFRYRAEECVSGKWKAIPRRIAGARDFMDLYWHIPPLVLKVGVKQNCHGIGYQVVTNYADASVFVKGHEEQGTYPVKMLAVAMIYDGNFVPGDGSGAGTMDTFPYGSNISNKVTNHGYVEVTDQIRSINVAICAGFTGVGTMQGPLGTVTRVHVHTR